MTRELVLRAQDGDHEAFTALVAQAIGELHRVARLIVRSDEAAADAVQDALMEAWLHVRAVRDPDRFDAWLRRLLVHACYRTVRRNRRRAVTELRVRSGVTDSHEEAAGLVARDSIERGFRRLTPEQRAVLVLRHYLDLSDAEAARTLGIPVGTFKSRLSRASIALRAAIEADDRASTQALEVLT